MASKKYDFKKIALMWRPEKGKRRIQVGTIHISNNGDNIRFEYLQDGISEAHNIDRNFKGYPGLPINTPQFSAQQISEVFFSRLINPSRNDALDFYKFWLVDISRTNDPLYILAQTQGLSFTDMFEFVPQYYSSHKHSFITDIAGLSKIKYDLSKLSKGNELVFTQETDNQYDNKAVYVSFNGEKIGYIKQGHNTIFARKNTKGIRLYVWSVTNAPGFEKLYVRVEIKR